MTPYTPTPTFNTTVQLVDTTDVALGGSTGISNVPIKQLANNEAYLYAIMNGFENINTYSNSSVSGVALTAANCLRSLIAYTQVSGTYFTFILPAVSSYRLGGIIAIQNQGGGPVNPITISAASGDAIYDRNGGSAITLYTYPGETVYLMNIAANTWKVLSFDGNYYRVGDQFFGYNVPAGALQRTGTLVLRAKYPRLWAFANAISGLVITDAAWIAMVAGNYPNKSFFSSGDGSTTFRLPDDRGLFDRAMDLNANVDNDRYTGGYGSQAGNKEFDAFRDHAHGYAPPIAYSASSTPPSQVGAIGNQILNTASLFAMNTALAGGSETRPINVAKQPLIIY